MDPPGRRDFPWLGLALSPSPSVVGDGVSLTASADAWRGYSATLFGHRERGDRLLHRALAATRADGSGLTTEVFLLMGLAAHARLEWRATRDAFSSALAELPPRSPAFGHALLLLTHAILEQGAPQEVEAVLSQLSSDDSAPFIRLARARFCLAEGALEAAVDHAASAAASFVIPSPWAAITLAEVHLADGKPGAALSMLRPAWQRLHQARVLDESYARLVQLDARAQLDVWLAQGGSTREPHPAALVRALHAARACSKTFPLSAALTAFDAAELAYAQGNAEGAQRARDVAERLVARGCPVRGAELFRRWSLARQRAGEPVPLAWQERGLSLFLQAGILGRQAVEEHPTVTRSLSSRAIELRATRDDRGSHGSRRQPPPRTTPASPVPVASSGLVVHAPVEGPPFGFRERWQSLALALGAWRERARNAAPRKDAPEVLWLGRYQIRALLGQGGMGRVFRVYDTVRACELALKIATRAGSEEGKELEPTTAALLNTRHEYYALSRLPHPNIVRVFDFGALDNGDTFLTMEWVDGQDLQQRVAGGPLPVEEACDILEAVARALHFIHSRLFVHGDVKSENVRIARDGTVKLIDFGLLHPLGTTGDGSSRGSPHAMAPEIILGRVIDEQSDLYALGVLAFELLTGRPPFFEGTVSEVLRQHSEKPPPRPSELRPELASALDALVLSCLEKNPLQRPPGMSGLLNGLAAVRGRPPSPLPLAHRTSYLRTADLVGRQAERARLNAAWEQTVDGVGAAVFVGARAGIGKTRLVFELQLQIRLMGVPCLFGQCRSEGLTPFAPLSQALGPLIASSPPSLLDQVGPSLAKLVPELGQRYPAGVAFEDPLQEKAAVFKAVATWLAEASKERPILLWLEDLHWADAVTLHVVNGLAREIERTRVLMVCSYRPDELTRPEVLGCLETGDSEVLELAPLGRAELRAMTSQMLRLKVPDAFFDALFEKSGGICFLATEMLRASIESGRLALTGDEWTVRADAPELPGTMEEVVAQRLATVGPELASCCEVAAVAGRTVDLALLAGVTGLPEARLFDCIDEMVERQFIDRSGARLFFTHEWIREAFYQRIPDQRRQALHLTLARALQARHGDTPDTDAALIAHHYLHSPDRLSAVRLLSVAGEAALRLGAQDDATRLFRQASQLLEGDTRPEALAQKISLWARIVDATFVGEPQVAIQHATKLLDLWTAEISEEQAKRTLKRVMRAVNALPSPLRRPLKKALYKERPFRPEARSPLEVFPRILQYRAIRATSWTFLCRWAEADVNLSKNLDGVPDERSALYAAILTSRATMLVLSGNFHEAHVLCGRAYQICEENQETLNSRLMWTIYSGLLSLMLMNSNVVGRPLDETVRRRAQALAERLNLIDFKFYAVMVLHQRACLTGDAQAYESAFASTYEVMRHLGYQPFQENRIVLLDPHFHIEQGQLEKAERATAKLERTGRWLNDPLSAVMAQNYRAWIAMERDQLHAALESLNNSRSRCETERLYPLNQTLCLIAECLVRKGELAVAERFLRTEALPRFESQALGGPLFVVIGRRLLAEAVGGEAGLEDARKSLELAKEHGLHIHEGFAHRTLARLLSDANLSASSAHAHEERAEAVFRRIGNGHQVRRLRASGAVRTHEV